MKKPSKSLIAKWDKKLAESGFDDIEHRESENLKKHHSYWFAARYSPLAFESKRQYYDLATQYLNEGTFETERDKKIWSLHAEGLTYSEIGKIIKLHFTSVGKIVTKLKEGMEKFYGVKGKTGN